MSKFFKSNELIKKHLDNDCDVQFDGKKFHLSGKFEGKGKRGGFPEKLESLGGIWQEGKGKKKITTADYFIIGNKTYREKEGANFKSVIEHNANNPKAKIPVISESRLLSLIDSYKPSGPN